MRIAQGGLLMKYSCHESRFQLFINRAMLEAEAHAIRDMSCVEFSPSSSVHSRKYFRKWFLFGKISSLGELIVPGIRQIGMSKFNPPSLRMTTSFTSKQPFERQDFALKTRELKFHAAEPKQKIYSGVKAEKRKWESTKMIILEAEKKNCG